ncbi:gliding motility-associated C-terminal domain-containing protein [Sediminicola sp. 1XM1-17]|uniref:gliding motility-associated C-terminal domain-containing protein n=1 Tax=Sediminicola sp. 1XM1-17 TaxID=3127702 RepID=UPI003077FF80
MRNLFFISFLILSLGLQAQTALYNSGNIRIHEEGQIGFHTNLINDASFDQNVGLAGFYGNNAITVSGAFMPIFYDIEFFNDNGVYLNTSMALTNDANFVGGDVITPRNLLDIYLNFLQNGDYFSVSDITKVDGYAAITDKQFFSFPVGNAQQIRPLILNSEAVNTLSKCAYFFEDPNNPTTFATSFNTSRKTRDVDVVSTTEFWHLTGNVPSTITISWNQNSNISRLTDAAYKVGIAGWSKVGNQWVDLGSVAQGGDLTDGFVSSEVFVPDDYAAITLASLAIPTEVVSLDNYYLTPNNDGLNDALVIPELEQSPNNHVRIFDRFGLKVFDKVNYTNEFRGYSNTGNVVVGEKNGLPAGVYFYLVTLDDLGTEYQGFLYLRR